ncbi:ABC transporter ATP-binding protein [Candidatus Borrarchaeum sp.]|uniref:metal ABC transporter ATP-binding protein n=1 Tax=Candidatus Borrarchaeum sp. TaxID=2846742 RepID=UPI00257AF28B|nr:ABC transporter ATP-binding protein [Candidatus Borrarchaeum sp.]
MNAEIVSLKNVSVYFNDVSVLEDITFSIKQNDFLAIIGPNGGGKTTLLKVILGLIKPNRGEVAVFGKTPEEGRKLIGYLPQYTSFDLKFPINVFNVVLMGRYNGIFKRYSKEDKEAVINALKIVEMLEFRDRQIGKLSGGQLQRVLLARALARERKLLVLDEPMTNIDPEMQQSFYELLVELKKEMTIVLVTHDIGVVSVYVDEIACLNRKLVYHGSKETALKKLEDLYKCPVELIAHGIPHRVLKRH